ncbi:MAG: hypothetical protein ABH870_03445 [bacterium]
MAVKLSKEHKRLFIQELNDMPGEYFSNLLEIVHLFKESVSLKPAKESFKQGWREANKGVTYPVSDLWEGISAE